MEILDIYHNYIRFDYFQSNIRVNNIIERTPNKLIIETYLKYFEHYFFDVPFSALLSLDDSREVLHIKINKIIILKDYIDRWDMNDEDGCRICLFPTFIYELDYELVKIIDVKNGYTNEFLDYFEEFTKNTDKKYEEKQKKYKEKEELEQKEYELLRAKWEEYKKENNLLFDDYFLDAQAFDEFQISKNNNKNIN